MKIVHYHLKIIRYEAKNIVTESTVVSCSSLFEYVIFHLVRLPAVSAFVPKDLSPIADLFNFLSEQAMLL
jgi:hypothetical protein